MQRIKPSVVLAAAAVVGIAVYASAYVDQTGSPPGTAGTGLQLTDIDIGGDGDLDLVCPGKSGLYLFENLGNEK